MKLGVWNRLAIVLGGLTLLIGPPALMLDMLTDSQRNEEVWLNSCQAMADENPDFVAREAARDKCWDDYINSPIGDGIFTWRTWWETFTAFAAALAVLYALIFTAQWLVRWVLAGRKAKNTE